MQIIKKIFLITPIFCLLACFFDDNESELCFIGDSITYQWDLNYFFPEYSIKRHAVIGAKIDDIDNWDVSDCTNLTTVILMGTNNIGTLRFDDPEIINSWRYFAEHFMDQARKINAKRLVVISILPHNYLNRHGPSVNKNIERQNTILLDSLRASSLYFDFVNAFPFFLEDGYHINKEFFSDGLHLSLQGYEILTKLLRDKL